MIGQVRLTWAGEEKRKETRVGKRASIASWHRIHSCFNATTIKMEIEIYLNVHIIVFYTE